MKNMFLVQKIEGALVSPLKQIKSWGLPQDWSSEDKISLQLSGVEFSAQQHEARGIARGVKFFAESCARLIGGVEAALETFVHNSWIACRKAVAIQKEADRLRAAAAKKEALRLEKMARAAVRAQKAADAAEKAERVAAARKALKEAIHAFCKARQRAWSEAASKMGGRLIKAGVAQVIKFTKIAAAGVKLAHSAAAQALDDIRLAVINLEYAIAA